MNEEHHPRDCDGSNCPDEDRCNAWWESLGNDTWGDIDPSEGE